MLTLLPPFDPNLAFNERFLEELNHLSAENALDMVNRSLLQTATMADRYEYQVMNTKYDHPDFAGYQHAWWIDCNNVIRLKKLQSEIESEL